MGVGDSELSAAEVYDRPYKRFRGYIIGFNLNPKP